MFGSLKTNPELKDLPAAEQKRAWRGGARYALNRLPFLFTVIVMIVAYSVLSVFVIEPAVPNKLWRFCISIAWYFVFISVAMRLMVHYARPYWRELRERDG
jgi:uncharacterized membrane protein